MFSIWYEHDTRHHFAINSLRSYDMTKSCFQCSLYTLRMTTPLVTNFCTRLQSTTLFLTAVKLARSSVQCIGLRKVPMYFLRNHRQFQNFPLLPLYKVPPFHWYAKQFSEAKLPWRSPARHLSASTLMNVVTTCVGSLTTVIHCGHYQYGHRFCNVLFDLCAH